MTPPYTASHVVLVIDDDDVNRIVLKKLFEKERIDTLLAESGTEGIALARRHEPALILLDIFMPEDDGFDILARLKKDKILADIPVCIFSILEDREKIKKAYSMGACAYITKPFDMKETVRRVREILAKGPCSVRKQ
jgi:CheY-like chemotaxis protein